MKSFSLGRYALSGGVAVALVAACGGDGGESGGGLARATTSKG